MNKHLTEEIERAERTLEIISRVHGELEDGKPWSEIDNGLRSGQQWSYEEWFAYMQARCRGILESIVQTSRHDINGQ